MYTEYSEICNSYVICNDNHGFSLRKWDFEYLTNKNWNELSNYLIDNFYAQHLHSTVIFKTEEDAQKAIEWIEEIMMEKIANG